MIRAHLQVQDVWDDGHWDISSLFTNIPHDTVEKLNRLRIWLHSNSSDIIVWKGSISGIYSFMEMDPVATAWEEHVFLFILYSNS